jgi:hypothetical protein
MTTASRADLDPVDRLFVAIVRQAISDYTAGISYQKEKRSLHPTAVDYHAARVFLLDLGLLNDAGEVTRTEQCVL